MLNEVDLPVTERHDGAEVAVGYQTSLSQLPRLVPDSAVDRCPTGHQSPDVVPDIGLFFDCGGLQQIPLRRSQGASRNLGRAEHAGWRLRRPGSRPFIWRLLIRNYS